MTPKKTQFVTFYSYKGGVGRTSALVNSAVLRALQGDKVVVVDFDLEAPGIPQYLSKIDESYDHDREGVLEYFYEAVTTDHIPGLRQRAVDLSARLDGKNGGKLWAINAGRIHNHGYWESLERLKWAEIFEKQSGELLLANFKNQIAEEFEHPDYVFLDSRTGITEVGGVCTRHLADILVILTSLNEQNIEGTSRIYRQLESEELQSVLVASNVPVGMPTGSDQIFTQRVDSFEKAFGRLPDIFVYHYPSLSLEEQIPALNVVREEPESLYQTDPLFKSYATLSETIDSRNNDSYTKALFDAARNLRRFMYDPDALQVGINLNQKYGDRYLASTIFGFYKYAALCLKNPGVPEEWGSDGFKGLWTISELSTHGAVSMARDSVEDIFERAIESYLRDTSKRMTLVLEGFLHDFSRLIHIANSEISKGYLDWPMDFYSRSSKKVPIDPLDEAICLYNCAHCLWETNRKDEAKELLHRFLESFKRIRLEELPASNRPNYYFCVAIAQSRAGRAAEAKAALLSADQQLGTLRSGDHVFSPITYTSVSVEELRRQISKFRDEQ